MRHASGADRRRELFAVFWLIGWAVLLWNVHRPWWLLGGWISPWLFWAERAALYSSPWLGFLFGGWRRRRLLSGEGAGSLRWTILPALLALFLVLSISIVGESETLGVATTGLCGFVAGGLTARWRLLLRPDIPESPGRRPPGRRARRKESARG